MKFYQTLLLIAIILILSCTMPQRRGMKPYDSNTFVTISGTVTSSYMYYNRHQKEEGLHLNLNSEGKAYIIHVCPKWYAKKARISFENGERITVSGSQFIKHGEDNIYGATIVRKGKAPLKLRNPKSGSPLWEGRYRREGNRGRGRRRYR